MATDAVRLTDLGQQQQPPAGDEDVSQEKERLLLALDLAKKQRYNPEPYLEYIISSWSGRDSKKAYMQLFAEVVEHFKSTSDECSIGGYINNLVEMEEHYYFPDTVAGTPERQTSVKDTIMLILGTWLMMQSYFIPTQQDQRRVCVAYCARQKLEYDEPLALSQSVSGLVEGSGLLPSPSEANDLEPLLAPNAFAADVAAAVPFGLHDSVGLLESVALGARQLNAVRLSRIADVEFTWTANVSRHLLLSKRQETYRVELFALPCAFQAGSPQALTSMGMSAEMFYEIVTSYASLFNPVTISKLHKSLNVVLGLSYWCLCLSCASARLRRRLLSQLKRREGGRAFDRIEYANNVAYDASLKTFMRARAVPWGQPGFTLLWPRILALDAHLNKARPWNFWALFRDRRDTVQYWTFLFGTVILILTVMQVILGAAQVAGSFR